MKSKAFWRSHTLKAKFHVFFLCMYISGIFRSEYILGIVRFLPKTSALSRAEGGGCRRMTGSTIVFDKWLMFSKTDREKIISWAPSGRNRNKSCQEVPEKNVKRLDKGKEKRWTVRQFPNYIHYRKWNTHQEKAFDSQVIAMRWQWV